jgi:hypothetical protein
MPPHLPPGETATPLHAKERRRSHSEHRWDREGQAMIFWVANSQEPEEDSTQATCARCGRHGEVRAFHLRLLDRIRHRA